MSDEIPEIKGKPVPVEYRISDELRMDVAQLLVAQHTEYEFVLSFFNLELPMILGDEEQRREQLERLESVTAKCVARVSVAPGRIREMCRVIQDNLENWETSFGVGGDDESAEK